MVNRWVHSDEAGIYAPAVYYASSSEELAHGVQSLLLRLKSTPGSDADRKMEKGVTSIMLV